MLRFLIVAFVATASLSLTRGTEPQVAVRAHTAPANAATTRTWDVAPFRLVGDRFHRGSRFRRWSRSPSIFGFSFGIGNYHSDRTSGYYQFDPYAFDGRAYDPYRFGRFEVPDPLDDPYFRERHRFDSHFRRPLLLKESAVSRNPPPHYRPPTHLRYRDVPMPRMGLPAGNGSLRSACQQLSQNLASREDGEAWIEFLAPDQIMTWVANGDSEALQEIMTHYDGIVGNPELRPIAQTPGFASTRQLLRQHVPALPPPGPVYETLPTPQPNRD